jgi:hypothetical protein
MNVMNISLPTVYDCGASSSGIPVIFEVNEHAFCDPCSGIPNAALVDEMLSCNMCGDKYCMAKVRIMCEMAESLRAKISEIRSDRVLQDFGTREMKELDSKIRSEQAKERSHPAPNQLDPQNDIYLRPMMSDDLDDPDWHPFLGGSPMEYQPEERDYSRTEELKLFENLKGTYHNFPC